MNILVLGAGNIGSLYAGLLQESGHSVSVLARGKRLEEIREHGIRLEEATSQARTHARVRATDRLDPREAFDLALVILPKDRVSEVLPMLAACPEIPSVMFFGNNAAGPEEMVEALGRTRVLLGFPGAAAIPYEGVIRYLILSKGEQPTTIGELDGNRSRRLEVIAGALESAGFPVAICSKMDAWLKTHVSEISPTANALYMAGDDAHRLARTRDALVLMLRAIKEGYRVLRAKGIPITPSSHRLFEWLPEPLLIPIMKRMVASDSTAIKIGHASAARKEMKIIADEFRTLAIDSAVATPAMDRLYAYLASDAVPITDGSAELPLRWGGPGAIAIILTILGAILLMR